MASDKTSMDQPRCTSSGRTHVARAAVVALGICAVGFAVVMLTGNLIAFYVTVPIALTIFVFMLARPYVQASSPFRDQHRAP
jgi:hypothetical protein